MARLENNAKNAIITGTRGNDLIYNYGYKVTIDAGEGNDTIYSGEDYYSGDSTSINGGAGNDYIQTGYYDDEGYYILHDNVTIIGGNGDDTIISYGSNAFIDGGDGADTINSHGSNVFIDSGDGNDTITSHGSHVSINSGSGNDFISHTNTDYSDYYDDEDVVDYSENIFKHTSGNDTIKGFNDTDTLAIADSTYSKSVDGNNLIITTNNGSITLIDAAVFFNSIYVETNSGDSGNGGGNESGENSWTLNGTTATYGTNNNTLITVTGIKSLDGLTLNDTTVKIAAAALNQEKVTITNGYTLAIADDVPTSKTTAAGWTLSGNIATYKNASTSAGYSLVNNQIVYNAESGGENLFTLTGVKSIDGISINGTTVKVAASALNNSNVTISNGYTLAIADDVPTSKTTAAGWTLSGTIATYKNASTSAGYSLVNNQIVYNAASGGETLFTLNGVKSIDGILINGTTVKVAASALNNSNVTISNGYTLAIADDVPTSKTTAAGWTLSGTIATYKNASTSAGYSLVNNQIVYNAASGGETLFTLNGVKSIDGISINGLTVKVVAASLNQATVTISNGYTLAIANDVLTPQTTAASWTLSGNVATYKNASTSAGYSLVNNQIIYNAASGGEDLITITGIKSLDGISISDKTVTVSNSALNQSTVTISNGYTLVADYDVPISTSTAAEWTLSGSTATYNNSSTSAGYQLVNNQLVYNAASGGETLLTVNGVKSTNGLTLNGKTLTVGASALNKAKVTVSDGYTLAIGDDVTVPKTTAAGWTLSGTTAIYKSASTTAGYKLLAGNQIVYNEAGGGESLITISGVKSLDGIKLNGKTVKIAASSLNKSKLALSGDGYKLVLADDVTNPKTTKAWAFNKKSKAAIYTQTTTAGYSLAGNGKSVTYSKNATKNLITVSGVKSASGLSLKGKVITLSKAALGTSKVTVTNGYKLALGSDVVKPKTTAAAWTLSGNTAIYKSSSKKAGYTLAGNGKSVSYTEATTATTLATIKGAKSVKGLTVSGDKITLKNSVLKNKVTISGDYEFDFAKDYKKATITGSKNADTITANGNNLSINGGAGNDTIKFFGTATTVNGGAGKDLFVYKSGNNVIADYAEEDKISIAGTAKVTASGSDVIFTVGKGKMTVKDGKDKKINYVDADGEHTYSIANADVSISGSAIKLLPTYLKDTFDVANYGDTFQTIDGSAVLHALDIKGNKLANNIIGSEDDDYIDGGAGKDTILGGDGNDTLIGGAGNDSLKGGNGSDIFVYNNGDGDDVIVDYADEDKIKFASGTIKSVKKSGNDVVFTVGSNKLTVKGAATKTVTYIDASDKTNYFPSEPKNSVILTGTSAILRENYSEADFTAANHGNSITTIDASSVTRNLKITGNGKANVILGGYDDDTITGGKGNDTLQGGTGKDVFVYANGDGKDIILDYDEEDTIKITKGTAKITKSGSDVVFTIGSGKMTVQNAAGKTITYIEGDKKKIYGSAPSFIEDDTDYELTPNLSSLVQSKAVDYSFLSTSNNLAKKDNLLAYAKK